MRLPFVTAQKLAKPWTLYASFQALTKHRYTAIQDSCDMSGDPKDEYSRGEKEEKEVDLHTDHADANSLEDAFAAENSEHDMSLWDAARKYPMACLWAFTMCSTIVMESFDMFLNGNFVALPAFQNKYGVMTTNGKMAIPTKWQSALNQAGQCGALTGVFLAGPLTTRIGYCWTTIIGLMLMNATIFVSFFADSLGMLVAGQALEGVPWGMFIANSPAYVSEIVPIPLRGACAATIQMSWTVGGLLVSAVVYVYNQRKDEWAWRVPLAIQWIFPTPLLIMMLLAPESPWWLVRHGKREQALRSLERLGRKSKGNNAKASLAMIERTVEIEDRMVGRPKLLDLFKGTDLRRTIIICLIYASQNFSGNLISGQAVFFFEQAGISPNFSFRLSLIKNCICLIVNVLSWFLTGWFRRRTLYLYGTATNVVLLVLMGVCASVTQNTSTSYAQAVLATLMTFVFAGVIGPTTYTIISETSSVRLRSMSTSVGRAAYYVAEIPMIYVASRLVNPTGWNLVGKCGYVWASTAVVCWIAAYFFLPETKHRSYRELDILFHRRVPARDFKKTWIDVKDDQ
ncbi:hypothetical protein BST61_g4204 [Cercospora zeina]